MLNYLNVKINIALGLIFVFLVNTFGPVPLAQAEDFRLPAPGVMVHLSPEFNPPTLKGIKVNPDNPFKFEFILDRGDSQLSNDALKNESRKLIKYFLASLTIPEKDLWVNLSPYEKDRIIPQSFGLTEMGRDLLAEDYMLKQITASLIYPDDDIGKKFWKRIYQEAEKKFGTTDIPVNTFNKVWIIPEKAVVYENAKAGTAYVVESKLKVMLEQDYLSLQKHEGIQSDKVQVKNTNQLGSQIVRELVIPELTKEVNENKNFSHLRQVYNSLILATWYKKKIKDSILGQVYENKNKVAGVKIDDPQEKEKIYQRYLQAFKKGVYNYIKEDVDPATQETVPRKYFSGGVNETTLDADLAIITTVDSAFMASQKNLVKVNGDFDAAMGNPYRDRAMNTEKNKKMDMATSSSGNENLKSISFSAKEQQQYVAYMRIIGVGRDAHVIDVGSHYDNLTPLVIASLGANYIGFDLESESATFINRTLSRYKLGEFGGGADQRIGEFSSNMRSNSKDIPPHSQDFVFIGTGALSDPRQESDRREVLIEALRVIKNEGKIIVGTEGDGGLEEKIWKRTKNDVLGTESNGIELVDEMNDRILQAYRGTVPDLIGRDLMHVYRVEFHKDFALKEAGDRAMSRRINPRGKLKIIDLTDNEETLDVSDQDFDVTATAELFDRMGEKIVLKTAEPHILIIGGTVQEADLFFQRYPKGRITIVNLSNRLLNDLQAHFSNDQPIDRLDLFKADASKLDKCPQYFKDQSFDLIIAQGIDQTLFADDAKLLGKGEQVLKAIAHQEERLLKPGGVIYHPYFNVIDYLGEKRVIKEDPLLYYPNIEGKLTSIKEDNNLPSSFIRKKEDRVQLGAGDRAMNVPEWSQDYNREVGLTIEYNKDLKGMSTFHNVAQAEAYVEPQNIEELKRVIKFNRERNIPFQILGKGSNTLFADGQIEGMVISTKKLNKIEWEGQDELVLGAGISTGTAVREMQSKGYSGLEFSIGIPGTVGGLVMMNGNYTTDSMQEKLKSNRFEDVNLTTGNVVKSVLFLDENGEIRRLDHDGLGFGYRQSIFQDQPDWTILEVTFKFSMYRGPDEVKRLVELMKRTRAVNETKEKGKDTLGCVFCPRVSAYGASRTASWFISQLEGAQTWREGEIFLDPLFPNQFLKNDGGTALDFIRMIDRVRSSVFDRFGVKLRIEPISFPRRWIDDQLQNLAEERIQATSLEINRLDEGLLGVMKRYVSSFQEGGVPHEFNASFLGFLNTEDVTGLLQELDQIATEHHSTMEGSPVAVLEDHQMMENEIINILRQRMEYVRAIAREKILNKQLVVPVGAYGDFQRLVADQDLNTVEIQRLWDLISQISQRVEGVLRSSWVNPDPASIATPDSVQVRGGIDLSKTNNVLQNQNSGVAIKFHIDAAQLARYQNAQGFTVGNIAIQPLKSLPVWLGISQAQASTPVAVST